VAGLDREWALNFMDLGWQEILLIMAIALIIFGPGRLPEIGRTMGKTVRAFRKATSTLTAEFTKELQNEEHTDEKGKENQNNKPADS